MQRGFGGTVFEPVQPERRDRELTLGAFTLTLLGCGLFALCGLCFVFGYAVGHRYADSSPAIALPPPFKSAVAQPASSQSKPSAGQIGAQPQQQAVDPADSTVPSDAPSATAGTSSPIRSSTADPATSPAEPVHAVLNGQSAAAQPVSGAGSVQPALAQPSGIMVQIAAVSHPEDAEVLVGALRKRGYVVTSRRDPTDGLLHVQIGPFANRTEASAMRQKLLNDGYNAIVQP